MRSLKACRPTTSASESRNFKSSTYARSMAARRLSRSRSDVTSCKLMRSNSFASGMSCSFESFDPGDFSWLVAASFSAPAMGGSRADPPLDSPAGGDPKVGLRIRQPTDGDDVSTTTDTQQTGSDRSEFRPFRVEISTAAIDDLRERLGRTRWPEKE